MPKSAKYRLKEVSGYISGENYPDMSIHQCAVDSRLVEAGDIFFALHGNCTDGHIFLEEVARKRAVAAVVRKDYRGPDWGLVLIKVEDPLQALQTLAKEILAARRTRVVGITGSVGKTTTKEFTYQLLKQKYRVAASPGNSNSQIGLPLAILNHAQGDEEIWVLEMGMTEAGNISQLVEIAPPECAVITKTALVHAQNFTGLRAIALAKGEILSHPHTRLGILSRDIADYDEVAAIGVCRKVSFSCDGLEADFRLVKEGQDMQILHGDEAMCMPSLPVHGWHNVHNFLAAAAVARYFDVDWELIKQAIPNLVLPERRLQYIQKGGIAFINDSYNASEVSVKAALNSLPMPAPGGKKIAVLGDMLELGRFSEKCHREVGSYALEHVSHMICLGTESKVIYELWKAHRRPVEWVENFEDLMLALKSIAKPGDVVLLKGSRAKGLWRVLDAI